MFTTSCACLIKIDKITEMNDIQLSGFLAWRQGDEPELCMEGRPAV